MHLACTFVFLTYFCVVVTAIHSSLYSGPLVSKPNFLTGPEPEEADDTHLYAEPCCRYKTISTEETRRIAAECVNEIENNYGLKISDDDEAGSAPADGGPVFSDGEVNIFNNRSVCIPQCYLQKSNAADSEGNVIPREAVRLMKTAISLSDVTFWQAVERICTKVTPPTDKFYFCKPDAMEFKFCVFYMADMHCPEHLQRKSKACGTYRQELKKRYSEE